MIFSFLIKKYYIGSISDSIDGFTIVLADAIGNSPKIKIIFENRVNAFRNSEEAFRLSTIRYLNENYDNGFYANWTFFKAENSEYLKWLSEQSGEISDHYGVMHYSIITDDEILDIAATYEPTVTFITEDDAVENSEKLNSSDIENTGKVGIMDDGRTVNVRNVSNDSRPTLEIYDPKTEISIKTRYGSKPETL